MIFLHMFLIISGCLFVLKRLAVGVCNRGGAGVCSDLGHLFVFF